MVIDFDEKEDVGLYMDLFGDTWKSKSSRKGLPHLWRLKREDDYSTDALKITINGKKTNIDLRYTNIFETADGKIDYIGKESDMPDFDFETYHSKPINEKPIPKPPKVASEEYKNFMGENTPEFKRFILHLKNTGLN